MKCKCSLNNNYEIIGLCDIEKFNEKISQFANKSWAQVIIPEILTLPQDKPPVNNVTKVYLDIKITSTKIIKTPTSNVPNAEGLALTGKLLLASGKICQRIMYISKPTCNTVCSVKFDANFSTYIIVDGNTDLENDNFCVYPCIEDVSIRPLNERTLSKRVTLFLFAHKTTQNPVPPVIPPVPPVPPVPPAPPDTKIKNAFIFKTDDTDEEMAKIEFNTTTKKLIVTSTGKSYNGGLETVFNFELIDKSLTSIKISLDINGNENANNFANRLNDLDFEYDDVIIVKYVNLTKLILTNFPNQGDPPYTPKTNLIRFRITENGLVSV